MTRLLVMAGLMVLAGLSACSDSHDELQQWMDEQRRMAKPHVTPLNPPRKFDPQPYVVAQSVDPFSSQKLVVALKQENRQPNSLLASEMNRRREPLEAYPLDSLTMVGSVSRGGHSYALMKAENLLYQVRAGEYIGQNYGRVLKITETELTLREIVQDAIGEWVERTSTLQLQEQRAGQEKSR
ncbi:MAG: pilus assembly protein PilP [Burkholderiales bacterium]